MLVHNPHYRTRAQHASFEAALLANDAACERATDAAYNALHGVTNHAEYDRILRTIRAARRLRRQRQAIIGAEYRAAA